MTALMEAMRIPHIARLLGAQALARLPQGALSVLLLIHSERTLGGYAAAGLVVAVFSIAAAIAGPLLGRLLAALGIRRVLVITVTIDSVTIGAFGLLPAWPPALYALAAIIGLFTPPVLSAVRSFYPGIVPRGMNSRVFSLDSITQELIWAIGPIVATVLLPAIGTSSTFLLLGVSGLVGGLLIAVFPLAGTLRLGRSPRRLGAVLLKWPVLVAVLSSVMLNAGYGAAQTGIVATFPGQESRSGLILSAYAVSSIIAGMVSVSFLMRRGSLAVRQIPSVVAFAAAGLSDSPWYLAACLAAAGIGAAPALAVMHNTVSSSLRLADAAEAVGWMGSAMLSGIALGSAVGGVLVDHFGPRSALELAAGFSLLGILVALAARGVLPDLSLRSGPPDDTSAIPVIRLRPHRQHG